MVNLHAGHTLTVMIFKQRGVFLMTRALLIVGILLAMLVVPAWLKRGETHNEQALLKAEEAKNARPVVAVAPTSPAQESVPVPVLIGHGLTFGLMAPAATAASDVVHLGCQGEPKPLDQAHENACNPYQGDTSCRTVLPVLCIRPSGAVPPSSLEADFYKGWTGGMLSATQPVMGAILESEAIATARCEKELGEGWRMAEFHDGKGGWGVQGYRGVGLSGNARYWVHVNDQRANCWNSGG